MNHRIHSISAIRITAPFCIELVFEDRMKKNINFLPVLKGEMYGPLANENYFNKVCLDPEVHTITWPNGADFDPETLYNWEQYREELAARAMTW